MNQVHFFLKRAGRVIPRRDMRISFYRSSGPGGQRKNKVETAVRITHVPTGITAAATEHRSQAQNRALALQRLEEKLRKRSMRKKPRFKTSTPRSAVERRLTGKKKITEKKTLRRMSDDELRD
jgi:protein subunit release factor B